MGTFNESLIFVVVLPLKKEEEEAKERSLKPGKRKEGTLSVTTHRDLSSSAATRCPICSEIIETLEVVKDTNGMKAGASAQVWFLEDNQTITVMCTILRCRRDTG